MWISCGWFKASPGQVEGLGRDVVVAGEPGLPFRPRTLGDPLHHHGPQVARIGGIGDAGRVRGTSARRQMLSSSMAWRNARNSRGEFWLNCTHTPSLVRATG